MFVVVINIMLKALLQLLADFEKHWTKSDKERAYAVAAFVSQLLNSVLVLLLVNANVGRPVCGLRAQSVCCEKS